MLAVKRPVAVVVSVLLVAAACGGGDDEAAPTTTVTTSVPSTSRTTVDLSRVAVGECDGVGAVPGASAITWIADGRLWQRAVDGGEPTCLLEASQPSVEWGGAGDRVRIGDSVVLGDDVSLLGDVDRHLRGFSRPTGTAVLARATDGPLFKLPVDGSEPVELPSFHGSEEAIYHPAGTAIVSVQPLGDRPGLILASNLGHDPRWLVDNETASELRSLSFTADGDLLFIATHEGRQHVHRLDLTTNTLSTEYELEIATGSDERLLAVVASPFRDDDVAVSRSATHQLTGLWVQRDGAPVDLAGTPVEHGDPIGWLPDGGLLVAVYEDDVHCCDVPPFDLYVLRAEGAERIAGDVAAAAVRAVLPPPPPPPPDIEQAAPA